MADDMLTMEIDGHPVTGRLIKITKTGDGLSEAMKLENHDLEAEQIVDVIVRCKVADVNFKPDKKADDGSYKRIDVLEARSARIAPVGFEQVASMMDEHEAAVAEMKLAEAEAKRGIERMPFDDKAEDQAQQGEDGAEPNAADRALTSVPDPDEE